MDFDIVVVGAGTAGCTVAAYLARHTSLSIGLLEAGGGYPRWALHAPLAGLRLRPRWSWRHETVPMAGLANRPVVFPMGRVVGGTSAVNAMIAAAGHPRDYDFLDNGSTDANRERCLEDLEALGMRIQAPRYRSSFTRAFLDACCERGLRLEESLDGSASQACGMFPLFQDRGCRWSAAHLLRERRCRERIRVVRRAAVRAVTLHGARAVGVELEGATRRGTIRTRVGVVLAAGVLQTPCVLQRSGIGPRHLLESAGIGLVADLPGVGSNLQDHVGVPWVVPSRVATPGRPSRWLPAAIRYAIFRDGVMASNCCEAGCFLGEPGSRPSIEVFTHFQTAKHANAVEFSTVLLHPASRGDVGIDPAHPRGPLRIDPNYFSSADDLLRLAAGLRRTIEIANSDALLRYGLAPSARDVDEDWIRRHATTYYHPAGTCRLGDDPLGVVSRDLRVHGIDGLWVADNSVVPEVPGGHTALTAMLIGAQAGRSIAARSDALAGS
jgi:choline dehydrogenase